ncbi:MAG: glycosyltransferase [Chloroflexota bacterium]|nr:glycosyltransferase [Chloroflexota bacterium]
MLTVSAIVVTFNRADYLPEALDSIFSQEMPPLEVIVVDDGSVDDTKEVVGSYGDRILYVWQENQGVSAARNRGLSVAQGDLIAWLDSDDAWQPAFLSTLVQRIERDPGVDGAYSGRVYIDSEGKALSQSVRVEPDEALYASLIEDNFLTTSSLIVKRSCYESAGPFDRQFRIGEDYDMWLRFARRHRIVGMPEPLVRYRVHSGNTVADADKYKYYRLALTGKQFGELGSDRDQWTEEARLAHGFSFRSVAFNYFQAGQMDEGWYYLQQAISIYPDILERLDTYYEVLCGDQPLGLRGQAQLLDIDANSADLLRRLDALFYEGGNTLQPRRPAAYGNAYLAMAMLNDQAGNWSQARRCIARAIRHYPALLGQQGVLRRFVKLSVGQSGAELGRSFLDRSP